MSGTSTPPGGPRAPGDSPALPDSAASSGTPPRRPAVAPAVNRPEVALPSDRPALAPAVNRPEVALPSDRPAVAPDPVGPDDPPAPGRPAASLRLRSRVPELLAPAGDWECVRAAVENGADAIYFGLDKFNARMRAQNFTETDLPALMAFLHLRGVRGYVTVNTLVFEDELADAERYLRSVIAAGVDAVIVQDIGICRLIRQLSPDFPIHASTQMTITSAAGVEFARDLGCHLVVLARECSLVEIARIQEASASGGLPLEVFVHGALCVAYSGQCLTSESLGGRSANRGECAQACRMPYDLICDGEQVSLGDRRYLLSPQDLAGIDLLPELADLGVVSLKIEGRLKAPEYVANITQVYRRALDRLRLAGSAGDDLTDEDSRYSMEMAFSRGLSSGWFRGIDNQELVHARFGKKRGVQVGEVLRVHRDSVVGRLGAPLELGDGVVFDAGRPDEREEGGRVYEIRPMRTAGVAHDGGELPAQVELSFAHGRIDFSRVGAGDRIWKTSDPGLERRWRQSFSGTLPKFTRPLSFEVHGRAGTVLTVIARDGLGHVARAESPMSLVPAETRPLTTEQLRAQLGRLGGTPFALGEVENRVEGEVMLPVSELNRLRREVVTEIERQRALPRRWQLVEPMAAVLDSRSSRQGHLAPAQEAKLSPVSGLRPSPRAAGCSSQLIVLVRSLDQLEAALRSGVTTIYCDFENPKRYREAVPMARGGPDGSVSIFVAPPRIFKPGEEWTLEQVRSSGADGYLVRNYDHLRFFAADRKVGDFSLNVANHLSAEYFRNVFGLERVTASYDLDFEQLEALLAGAPPEWFEVTIHQHMPMFHMEHCVFCAFLSTGKDYRDCGRPCDVHDVRLRDRVGAEHPLKADAGCRNTVFNSQAQTGAEYVERMQTLGARHFRVEFLTESPADVTRAIGMYRQLLRGEITGAELWRELKLLHQLGVTRGQMAGTRR